MAGKSKGNPEDKVDSKIQGRAHYAVSKAILKGELVRPEVCEECGESPPPNARGVSQIQGHHHKGYNEEHWLDVQWLCQKCHRDVTPDNYYPKEPDPLGSILEGGSYEEHDRRLNLKGYRERLERGEYPPPHSSY